jgi:ferrous iron transport protein B
MAASSPTDVERTHQLVALVGNPNTGKTTLFNALTGFHQRVANYPGVTVDRKTGFIRGDARNSRLEVIDLPGTYGLTAHSADEAVVLEVLLGRQESTPQPDLIVCVVDATNLSRNLFFTCQMLEIGRPVVIALNMIDIAEASGIRIDADALAEKLGVPVVPVAAVKQIGIEKLKRAIADALDARPTGRCASLPDCVCAELDGLNRSVIAAVEGSKHRTSRVELLQTLLDPGGYHEAELLRRCGRGLAVELAERRERIAQAGESIVEVEGRVRYAWIDGILKQVVTRVRPTRRPRSDAIDRVLTHRVVGLGVLLLTMAICFEAIYGWVAPLMDAVDGALGALGGWLAQVIPTGAIESLVVNGVIAGVGAVLTFLPQILVLFLFLAILEDCGYMARAAFLLDRWMGLVGLNGKCFIPLLSSFACAVPGIMATRTIEDRRSRFVTILIAPFMSCSARLPVYVLFIAAFIPAKPLPGGFIGLQAATMLAMYLVGILVAIPVTLILQWTLLKGAPQPFLMELPSYKWPAVRTVVHRVYEQGKAFCVSAGTIIFAVTIVVWALGYYPRPASVAEDHQAQRVSAEREHAARLAEIDAVAAGPGGAVDKALQVEAADRALDSRLTKIDQSEAGTYLRRSFLGRLGAWIEPAVKPLGWDWRIGTAVIASFPAREVVIATMGTIYNLGGEQDEVSVGLRQKLHASTWPDGRKVFNVPVALSIMVFYALCCQCGATLATIKRETNSWRWPLFTFTYMTALAYLGALVTYQVAIRLV